MPASAEPIRTTRLYQLSRETRTVDVLVDDETAEMLPAAVELVHSWGNLMVWMVFEPIPDNAGRYRLCVRPIKVPMRTANEIDLWGLELSRAFRSIVEKDGAPL